MIRIVELERALSDLAEVRGRLAQSQRFGGYSAAASAASGIAAIAAGVVQWRVAPLPKTPADVHAYLATWMICLAAGLALNYGAVAMWLLRNRGPGARSQFRSAALSIAPSILLGGALTLALVDRDAYALLPGTWFAFYAIGLFASRNVIPEAAFTVTIAFGILALGFLVTPLVALSLAWWVMPLGFGTGQIAIAAMLWKGAG